MSFTVVTGAVATQFVQHEKEREGRMVRKKKRGESSLGYDRAKTNLLFWPFMPEAHIDTVYK